MMLPTAAQLCDKMEDAMRYYFSNKEELETAGLTASVWEEGGEWLPYDATYDDVKFGEKLRDIESIKFVTPLDVTRAADAVEKVFESGDTYAISLSCGAGKSTKFVSQVHSLKLAVNTFVVEPSTITAASLSEYCNLNGYNTMHVMGYDALPTSRGCYYLSAACLLDMILRGRSFARDIVLFDEAHCVTPVYRALRDALDRIPCKLLLMTASTSSQIVGIRGSRMTSVNSKEPTLPTAKMTAELVRHQSRAVTVGVQNETNATPANLLIGATFDVRVVFDTGLRMEPAIDNGTVVFGERQAQQSEIVQMVGRVGRTGISGHAYYVLGAKAIHPAGICLYTVIYQAYRTIICQDTSLTRSMAFDVLKLSGLIKNSVGKPIVDSTPHTVHDVSNAHLSQSIQSSPPLAKCSEHVKSDSTSSDESFASSPPTSIYSSEEVNFDTQHIKRVELAKSTQPQERSAVGSSFAFPDSDDSGLDKLISTGGPAAARKRTILKHVTLEDESKDFDGRFHALNLRSDNDGQLLRSLADTKRQVANMMRPFSRGAVSITRDVTSATGLPEIMYAIAMIVEKGGTIYPEPFGIIDENQVSSLEEREAHAVLAGNVMPSFSEVEMTSILYCWDKVVSHTRFKMHSSYLEQFTRYFLDYAQYAFSRPHAVSS